MRTIVLSVCVLSVLCAEGRVFHSKQGHRVTIECGVNFSSRVLKWEREGTLVHSLMQRSGMPIRGKGQSIVTGRSKVGQNNNLEINPVKTEDAGQFACIADGTRHEHRLVVVSVSAQPSADLPLDGSAHLQCQVYGVTSGSVRWKSPSGQFVDSQTVDLKPVRRADTGTWQCIFTIDGATVSEPLTVRLTEPAPSTATPLHPEIPKDDMKTTCPTCGQSTPSLKKPRLELHWWVWVAVGVGGLVVILLIISIIVMYKRIRRRKKRLSRMKNGNQMKPKQYCQCRDQRPTAAAKTQQGRRREKPSALPLQPLLTQ